VNLHAPGLLGVDVDGLVIAQVDEAHHDVAPVIRASAPMVTVADVLLAEVDLVQPIHPSCISNAQPEIEPGSHSSLLNLISFGAISATIRER
jgi:hypothetical protein